MKRFFNVSLAAALALASVSCSDDNSFGPALGPGTTRVLFIGNSLTYTNDLPRLVRLTAAAIGKNFVTESVALPNYALIDHWNDGSIQQTIREGDFDYVVLQQGPSSLPINRDSLRLVTALFDPLIRESGATTALFAVWPEVGRSSVFPDVAESYRLAAVDVGGLYLPVGNAWLATWEQEPNAPLYGPDGYHPGLAGSYAAAAVMVAAFTGTSAQSLPVSVPGIGLSASLMGVINSAAGVALSSSVLLPR